MVSRFNGTGMLVQGFRFLVDSISVDSLAATTRSRVGKDSGGEKGLPMSKGVTIQTCGDPSVKLPDVDRSNLVDYSRACGHQVVFGSSNIRNLNNCVASLALEQAVL